MAYDLVIKNGLVVDGSGQPGFRADVGIKDGRIVSIGRISGEAKSIDAEGLVVAPGFVDIHTHYDAQIMWDPLLAPSPWHGVTTAVMGNCGYTLAPATPSEREYITRLIAVVEGVNYRALEHGLDWSWQSFPEYLRRIDRPCAINVAAQVGHSAVRRCVMGGAAVEREATEDEIGKMRALVREALVAGAFGFTSSRSPQHFGPFGEPVPSRFASHREVVDLGSTLAEICTGSIGLITENSVAGGDRFSKAEEWMMATLSLQTGRPVNWNSLRHTWDQPDRWSNQLEFMQRAAQAGAQVYAIAKAQPVDSYFTLRSVGRFGGWPTWKKVLAEPQASKAALLKDPTVRSAMKREAEQGDAQSQAWAKLSNAVFLRSKSGRFARFAQKQLHQIAGETGKDAVDVLIDWTLEEDFEAEFALLGVQNGDLNAVAKFITSPYAIGGISDAGAHTNTGSGANYSTFILSRWVREKAVLTLEDAVRRMTFLPARTYGLWDRGLIREGMAADLVAFDLAKVNWSPAEWAYDFPGGEGHLVTRAEGVPYVVVNGQVAFQDGRHTGALPGKLLKSSEYRFAGASAAR